MTVAVVHASVAGRLRLRVERLRGDRGLGELLVQRFEQVQGVRHVSGNVRTGSLLVLFEPAVAHAVMQAMLHAIVAEVVGLTRLVERPSVVTSELPLKEASRAEVLALAQRVASWLTPAPPLGRDRADAARSLRHEPEDDLAWHVKSTQAVLTELGSGQGGLLPDEASTRLGRIGPNALPVPEARSKWSILAGQLRSAPVAMLGASALLSVATGGLADALAILTVVAANAAIGYVTESKAEKIISSLGRLQLPEAMVLRGGVRCKVAPEDLVPGDLVAVTTGAFVPADARLLACDGLVVDESALTGESVPVRKTAAPLVDAKVPLADRVNLVFRGTLVTGGSGLAVVVATGAQTQLGRVQALAGAVVQRATPLQLQLERLGLQLATVAGGVCAAVFGIGLLRGYPPLQMLNTSVSLAVAAIPEGLPTVAITTLALGIRHLAERRVLVRQLNAVETLGAVQVMCLDKTGTITINRMTAAALFVGMRTHDPQHLPVLPAPGQGPCDVSELLRVAVLCNEVELERQDGVIVLRGSPTEAALVQLALDAGLDVQGTRAHYMLDATQYRSETRSYMATRHKPRAPSHWLGRAHAAGGACVAVKGRVPEVLALCRAYLHDGAICELTDAAKLDIETASERMAGRALRVLGFAASDWRSDAPSGDIELDASRDLVWLGLVGMVDPPRPAMREILQRFHGAGIRTVMITGDQSATAYAIGKAIGLGDEENLEILDSTQLDGIPPEVLKALVQRIHIFSRVSPAHKLQIVQALQDAGLTVAMTGDGVNDGPALRAADVGVAMGGAGTAAAREVADVVLEDDNLATMVGAIEQGRAIYDDIKKAVRFILSTNMSEILLTVLGVAAGVQEVLTPLQLLWINLLSDIFPELALAVQPAEADVLRRPPRDASQPMFSRGDLRRVAREGGILTTGPLIAYGYGLSRYGAGPRSRTLAFTVLSITQLLHVISARSETHSIFDSERLSTNRYVPMALGGGLALQVLATLVPGLRRLLAVVPLGVLDWGVVGLTALGPLVANETLKVTARQIPGPMLGPGVAVS